MPDIDIILSEFREIKELVKNINQVPAAQPVEVIDTQELCKRLDLSEPTIITWRKKKTIPFFRIGSSVRFNWLKVVEALEKRNGK